MGKQTGLTVGKLKSMSVFFRDPHTGESYAEAVEVGWVHDGCRFASQGDCGSLHSVRRDGVFGVVVVGSRSRSRRRRMFWDLGFIAPVVPPRCMGVIFGRHWM
jgi:hypothetical protein